MKNKIYLSIISLVLFTSSIRANTSAIDTVASIIPLTAQGVSAVYKDAKTLVDTMAVKLDMLVQKAAPKLGVAANKVWDTLVKQQRVWAYMYTFFFFMAIGLWINAVARLKHGEKNATEYEWKIKDVILSTLSCLGAVALSITVAVNWSIIWTGWLNPDYGAIIQLAEFAKIL